MQGQNTTTKLNGKYFYLNSQSLICSYQNFKVSNRILNDVSGYSVDIDESNNLNIVAFDDNSNITYLKFEDGDLNRLVKKEKMTGAKSICYIKLFSSKTNNANMFILTKNMQRSEIYQLINYTQTQGGWRGQRIIDLLYFKKGHPAVKIDMDNNNNFHIVYKEYTGGIYKLKYKTYLSRWNKWSKREVLVKSKYDLSNILMLCDSDNNINVSWSTLRDKDIEVRFVKRELNPYKVTRWEETDSFPFIKNLTNPVLLEVNDRIRYGWRQNDTYHYIDTIKNKDSWIKKSSFKLMTHLSPATYIPDKDMVSKKTKIPNTYLYFSDDDAKLIGLEDLNLEIPVINSSINNKTDLLLSKPSIITKVASNHIQNIPRKKSLSHNQKMLETSDILKDLRIMN